MELKAWRKWKALLLCAGVLLCRTDLVAGPRVGGGGGDPVVDDVYSLIRVIAYRLEKYGTPKTKQILTAERLRKMIAQAHLESDPNYLYLDKVFKAAINYPDEKRIVFSKKAWDEGSLVLSGDRLVLHEFLGLLRIPDDRFQSTQILFQEMNSREKGYLSKLYDDTILLKNTLNELEAGEFSQPKACHRIGILRGILNFEAYENWLYEVVYPQDPRLTKKQDSTRFATIQKRIGRYRSDEDESIFFLDALCSVGIPQGFPYKLKREPGRNDFQDRNAYLKRIKKLLQIRQAQIREMERE